MVRVIFIHPDLGIGGAERLVVDAGLALQRRKHEVTFYTAHHDLTHCFPETVDGSLKVNCIGDWLPKSFGGYLFALCAYIRMIYLAIHIRFISRVDFDVAIVDQVSACIPFLCGYKNSKVLFYCHYPDQLLTQRKTFLKKVYRYFLDWVEEYTTGCADRILVNSKFTAGVFRKTFPSIKTKPAVLYPSLDFSKFDACGDISLKNFGIDADYDVLFVSVNRFERKKNLGLALHALEHLVKNIRDGEINDRKVHLVLAGGYDTRNIQNIQHYNELLLLTSDLKLNQYVTFLKSPSEVCKVNLLRKAACLIYTPDNEHFGIVPIEAMYCKTSVIAVNSGGPKETVVSDETGFLCTQNPVDFADSMLKFVQNRDLKNVFGEAGHQRVLEKFSFSTFSDNLNGIVQDLCEKKMT